ncbi:MarR family winged helix-turn-helix transcriptional regulator [Nubsella zeaxanthinifaciens]|jgi:DNA-binding MarR family transcriptional regulator|uniref:MarR family winged helix-turn-helix transcriptional regulator n=1 Tax=Nubsella zeaxanthinifaciens TaxID=392412 RepID=UPI000DE3F2C1|nr:MarR family winged helix-turn-helix transcriptional regulator [Nubsella zeaxanthinifaciens]
MSYHLVKEIIGLAERYEQENVHAKKDDVHGFVQWINQHLDGTSVSLPEPDWNGKIYGRSADSVINTSLVHLYRYAKQHAKEAIAGSEFSTSDDFFYLISLMSHGSMTKTALIKLNVHEKSAGIQIVNRLITGGFVTQETTHDDKRNRMISITEKGKSALNKHIEQMRTASQNVTEPLSNAEKMELIRLLTKLEDFHEARAVKL